MKSDGYLRVVDGVEIAVQGTTKHTDEPFYLASTVEQEIEQLRDDHVRTLDKAAAECVRLRLALAFYAEGHFDHGKRARDDLATWHTATGGTSDG